jgi:sodium transport system permease protein
VTLRPRVAAIVYGKELRETLRDRRTLIIMILLPLTLYPLVGLTFGHLIAQEKREQVEHASQVCALPALPQGLEADLVEHNIEIVSGPCSAALLGARKVQAVLTLPPRFEQAIGRGETVSAEVKFDETEESSKLASDRVTEAVDAYIHRVRDRALLGRGVPAGLLRPIEVAKVSVTTAKDKGAAMLSKVIPVLIIFMVVLGAFYPAVDLTAGERERGTLETLLVAPAERIEIVVGKWLAVATISTLSGLLNLVAMGATVGQLIRLQDAATEITLPWAAVGLSALALVPMALFFSALFMAVAALARTFKEAQNMITPVYLLTALPAMVAAVPGVEFTSGLAIVPGTGVALLVRGIIQSRLTAAPTLLALTAMLVYAGIALAVAARVYTSEDGVLAGAGGPELTLTERWRAVLGLGKSKVALAPTLTPRESMSLYSLTLILLYFLAIPLQRDNLVRGLLLTQWAILLGANLLFLRACAADMRTALALRKPSLRGCAAALLLGASTWILVTVLIDHALSRLFPVQRLSEEMKQSLMATPRSLAFDLFLIAFTPAICEELLFRGAILSGLRRTMRPWPAALLCGALFGLFHLQFVRMIPTALLGVIMSWLVIASRSIVPAMIFHFLNNGSAVVVARLSERYPQLDHMFEWRSAMGVGVIATACLAFVLGVALVRGLSGSTNDSEFGEPTAQAMPPRS